MSVILFYTQGVLRWFGAWGLPRAVPTADAVELSDAVLEAAAGGYTIERVTGGGGFEGDSFVVRYRDAAHAHRSSVFYNFDALYDFVDWELRRKGHAYGADD